MFLALIAGANPFAVLGQIATGALGSKLAVLETLNRATPLIFTGLAVAVAFRAKLWNIGAEAQFYAGAIMAVCWGPGRWGALWSCRSRPWRRCWPGRRCCWGRSC
jgi:ABC-type uncharacterized transport system permease subunit